MEILYLITARGGSKQVPGKNLRKLAGIPLVGFKAVSAMRSTSCSRLIISTDSEEIQQVAGGYGAESLFTRPAELATDTASSTDVVLHAMEFIECETEDRYDAVMLLEPSSPFARAQDYDRAVEIMAKSDANLVVGVREADVHSVFAGPLDTRGRITRIVDQIHEMESHRRQAIDQEYTMNGALYLIRWDFFKEHRKIYQDRDNSYGHVMDRFHSVEIDDMVDLSWAEFIAERGYIDIDNWR
jgi:CMP-N,N'-diacetyllegionaminic acid synthase